jgi:type IV pilus assembly protein PilB
MATPHPKTNLYGLARTLVMRQVLTEEAAQQAAATAAAKAVSFVRAVVEARLAPPGEIAQAAAEDFGLPLMDLAAVALRRIRKLPLEMDFFAKHDVLPVYSRGHRLFVAVADPTNMRALDEIKFQAGMHVDPVIVEADKLHTAIEELSRSEEESMSDILGEEIDTANVFASEDAEGESEGPEDGVDVEDGAADNAVVRFVKKVLLNAIRMGASDVHFEPYEKYYRIRYRQDGILFEGEMPPLAYAERIAARVKVLSRLDIAERRIPQDGRIKIRLSKTRAIDFRVSTCPTLFGEKVTVRVLDPSSARLGIDALGYEPGQKKLFLDAIARPQGMVLVTGPTGSGKTVSLYTALNILNTNERNISTAEDPAEINLPGINQVNVNPRVGLTFAAALKAFLRQDPDVIMVGEVRDLETAEIAIKAAQTGHLVLSTVHTNDAPQTINRLMNMGVAPYNIASSLKLVIAQRLARRLCKNCMEAIDVPREALIGAGFPENELADEFTVYRPVGCQLCKDGYKGRVGIYQVMPISGAIEQLIMEGANAITLAEQARKEGIPDLRTSGLRKIKAGITSLEELHRVTTD